MIFVFPTCGAQKSNVKKKKNTFLIHMPINSSVPNFGTHLEILSGMKNSVSKSDPSESDPNFGS